MAPHASHYLYTQLISGHHNGLLLPIRGQSWSYCMITAVSTPHVSGNCEMGAAWWKSTMDKYKPLKSWYWEVMIQRRLPHWSCLRVVATTVWPGEIRQLYCRPRKVFGRFNIVTKIIIAIHILKSYTTILWIMFFIILHPTKQVVPLTMFRLLFAMILPSNVSNNSITTDC